MKIAVVANGEWDKEWGKQELSAYDLIIAADGGANHVFASEYVPQVLVGDLDSILPEYKEICKHKGTTVLTYPQEKDETDLELALDYAAKLLKEKAEPAKGEPEAKCKDIFLLGATGGRIDHFLGNLFLLQKFWQEGLRIRMRDPDQELWLLEGQEKLQGRPGQKLSLLPLTAKAVVRTEGLQYPLRGETLYQALTRGISNVFLRETALVEVSEGLVLVIVLSPENTR